MSPVVGRVAASAPASTSPRASHHRAPVRSPRVVWARGSLARVAAELKKLSPDQTRPDETDHVELCCEIPQPVPLILARNGAPANPRPASRVVITGFNRLPCKEISRISSDYCCRKILPESPSLKKNDGNGVIFGYLIVRAGRKLPGLDRRSSTGLPVRPPKVSRFWR